MIVASLLFYVFAAVAVIAALGVISVKNPVHSVLFLILAFFNAAGLFVLLGAELIAMLLVIVYVGAVAVLFLFVVMMLNINFAKMKEGFIRYLPIGVLVAVVIFVELFLIIYTGAEGAVVAEATTPILSNVENTRAIGAVLYTDYIVIFQLAGLVLLVAMIGAIVLTHRQREGVRKQVIYDQVSRKPSDTTELLDMPSGEGLEWKKRY